MQEWVKKEKVEQEQEWQEHELDQKHVSIGAEGAGT